MLPTWAIGERDLRKYFRNPAILIISLIFPLVQLVILGYAFGGQIRGVSVAVVDLDHGPEALRVREKFQAIEANAKTFHVRMVTDVDTAVRATRDGTVSAAIVIPENYSRRVGQENRPNLGLVLDNTDPFVVTTLTGKMNELLQAINAPNVAPRYLTNVALDVVEIFPYIEYIQYLLPGSILLSIFVCAGIGGALVFIDDRVRGFHEGYLVTPVRKIQLVSGMMVAGTAKATFAALVITFLGSMIARVPIPFQPARIAVIVMFAVMVAAALVSMVCALLVRVNDPAVPRATVAILNTLLFFPSGAMYPTYSFPSWLKAIASVDPFAYGVHGFRALLLKNVGPEAILTDMVFLCGFSVACFAATVWLFPRKL